jgi:2-polyprenyl-6-hydroxyphenyl methylase/3-demethylubiquinone-9 3-methyltransferase
MLAPMSGINSTIDDAERVKFDALAGDWWNANGPLRTLHQINPARLLFIERAVSLNQKRVLDLGCGGGLLSEALARKHAVVTGLDISAGAIAAAKSHLQTSGLTVEYLVGSAEDHAVRLHSQYDVITCMELLEHVPDVDALLAACAVLLKPGGDLFLATISRTAKSYLAAIVTAEYLLKLLPRGTHDYARFIKPSELNQCLIRQGFALVDVAGIAYLPGPGRCVITGNPSVNYIAHARLRET